MSKERIAFEMMLRRHTREYFRGNMAGLIRGNIGIEDDGTMIRIYKVDKQGHNPKNYEIGIVY